MVTEFEKDIRDYQCKNQRTGEKIDQFQEEIKKERVMRGEKNQKDEPVFEKFQKGDCLDFYLKPTLEMLINEDKDYFDDEKLCKDAKWNDFQGTVMIYEKRTEKKYSPLGNCIIPKNENFKKEFILIPKKAISKIKDENEKKLYLRFFEKKVSSEEDLIESVNIDKKSLFELDSTLYDFIGTNFKDSSGWIRIWFTK